MNETGFIAIKKSRFSQEQITYALRRAEAGIKVPEICRRSGISPTNYAPNQKLAITMLIFTVFLGAVLLFSMEPLVGRLLTPYFGGAAHVWLTCLMFFQAMLLLGYLYAHLLVRKLGAWHLLFLLIPLASLPLQIGAIANPGTPVLAVLVTLVFHVALPFVALSTTAVVAQAWILNSQVGRNREPYLLYAASNAGSLLALLGYAFLIEPLSGLRLQSLVWSGAYIVYVLFVMLTWLKIRPDKEYSKLTETTCETVSPKPLIHTVYLQWILLSALPSAFLMATTNYLTLEVGSFPFVWVIPLALYLGSFIVTFRTHGGVPGFLKLFWLELLLAALALYLLGFVMWPVLLGQLCIFFAICIVAHGTLYELRPPGSHLTHFYLASAFGGLIGGAFVSLVAPHVFRGLFEYPLALILFAALFWWQRDKAFNNFWPDASRIVAWSRMLVIGILVFPIVGWIIASGDKSTKFRHRNFYGTYRIVDQSLEKSSLAVRQLVHGSTLHGSQFLDPSMHLEPTSYYYRGGPIYEVYELIPSPRRMAVIGLGSGSISTYAKKGDSLVYYEIDPDNEKIAREWFTYLKECKGSIRVIVGDGRLSMQGRKADKMKYDVITIDAFTGDGIPTHLLTREAISLYLDRLGENGIILFHISNRYYDLRPVLKSTASTLGLFGAMNDPRTKGKVKAPYVEGQWVALAVDSTRLRPLIDRGWTALGKGDGLRDMAPWTDDYINVLGACRIRDMLPF